MPRSTREDCLDKPDWYQDWLSDGRLNQTFVVWYDAWLAYKLFAKFETQWRHGSDGVTGLDYAATLAVIERIYKRCADQLAMHDDIQCLERGAMTAINEQRAKARAEAREKSKSRHGK